MSEIEARIPVYLWKEAIDPDWDGGSYVHNWRNYISEELREAWDSFTDDQKLLIAQNADEIASREHWD